MCCEFSCRLGKFAIKQQQQQQQRPQKERRKGSTQRQRHRQRQKQRPRLNYEKGQRRARRRELTPGKAKRNCSKLAQIFDGAAPFEQVQVFLSAPLLPLLLLHRTRRIIISARRPQLATGDHTTATFVPRRFCWFAPFGIVFCAQRFFASLFRR